MDGNLVKSCAAQLKHVGLSIKGIGFESTCYRFKAGASSFTPLYLCISEEKLLAVGSFYLVSMPGEVKSPMKGNGKTFHELTDSRERKL